MQWADREVEGMSHNGSQNNEISCSITQCFGGRVGCLQDQTELPDGYSLTNARENSSKSRLDS